MDSIMFLIIILLTAITSPTQMEMVSQNHSFLNRTPQINLFIQQRGI